MLSQISWTAFIVIIAGLAALYYGFIATVYFPQETLTLLLGRKNKIPPGMALAQLPKRDQDLMGPILPDIPTDEYLRRYQPISETETLHPKDNSIATTTQVMTSDVLEEEEAFFMVASHHEGLTGIEIALPGSMTPETQLHSNVSDLMESIQTLLRVIRDGEGDINDVRAFFPSLLAQYPLVCDSKYRYSINQYIFDNCRETLSDELSIASINELWCFPYPPQQAA